MRRGPRPARTASGRLLSPSRAALLETLQGQPEPTSLAALVALSGLHANTVREHLEALRQTGYVERTRAASSGRGRPGWLYAATAQSEEDPRPEYAGLAAALAAVIVRTSPEPADEARRAGVEWGRQLAQTAGPTRDPGPNGRAERAGSDRGRTDDRTDDRTDGGQADGDGADGDGADGDGAARRSVATIFDTMGFAPEGDESARELRLTRCPLLEAAHREPDVVCSVHLGIAEGALATYGAPTDGVELLPFAEPGACLLRLGADR